MASTLSCSLKSPGDYRRQIVGRSPPSSPLYHELLISQDGILVVRERISSALSLVLTNEVRIVKLPNAERAFVTQRKVTNYLLSTTHPSGRSKAAFFARFGFTIARWESLADALRRHAQDNEVGQTENTPFGTSYAVDGPLATLDGRTPRIRTVWFIETGDAIPRLVTADPLKEGRE